MRQPRWRGAPRNAANQDILPRDVGRPKVLVQARRMVKIRPNLEPVAIYQKTLAR